MKIKQLKWEDCIPTISSSVVSRAQALGYTFEVYLTDYYKEDGQAYAIAIDGTPLTWGQESPRAWTGESFAKETLQEWLEARIKDVVEVRAAEIQWDRPFECKYVSKDGLYTVHAAYDLGRFYPEFNHLGVQAILPDLSLASFGAEAAKSLEEAFARCQDHKQAEFERTFRSFL